MLHPKFQSCQRQDPAAAAHVRQGSAPSSFEVLEHETEAHLGGGMARREGSAGFQKNPCRGSRCQKPPPGSTNGERAINAVVEKHDVTSSHREGGASQQITFYAPKSECTSCHVLHTEALEFIESTVCRGGCLCQKVSACSTWVAGGSACPSPTWSAPRPCTHRSESGGGSWAWRYSCRLRRI